MALWLLAAGGCVGESADHGPPLPWPATAPPELPSSDVDPAVWEARKELGRLLFYDPLLSADRQTACATCHSEIWGMGDGLPRSVGQGAGLLSGPGRQGGAVLPRNAPGLWNLAFRETLLWDGRESSLEAQALVPLRDPDEMGRDPDDVVRDLRASSAYRALFARAFPGDPEPSTKSFTRALADFQRSLTSLRALYDGYVAGDTRALDEAQREGMFRFAALGCAECHVPPLFEREAYFDRGIGSALDDPGRAGPTGAHEDRGAFRVPTLRNAAFTAPYFHDGSVATLREAIEHELSLSGEPHDGEDVALLVRFVSDALKDESLEPDRPDSLPSGLPVPIDGTQIER